MKFDRKIAAVDRRALGAADAHNAETAEVVVPDPWSTTGGLALVVRSTRDDPLGKMAARGQVDGAQLAAGRRWQSDYEAAEIGGIRANDTTREPVDGGGAYPEPITDRQRTAVRRLTDAALELGRDGDALVRDVLARGMSIAVAAAARNISTKTEREYLGRRFRECLESLAVLYGLASKFGRNRDGRRTV